MEVPEAPLTLSVTYSFKKRVVTYLPLPESKKSPLLLLKTKTKDRGFQPAPLGGSRSLHIEIRWATSRSFRVCSRECDTDTHVLFSSGKLVYERIFSMCVDQRSALPGNVMVSRVPSCPSQDKVYAKPAFIANPIQFF